MNNNNPLTPLNKILFGILILLAAPIALWLYASQTMTQALRITFGSIYVLFLPGLVLSFVFFPKTKPFDEKEKKEKSENKEKGSIDWIERVALSFALSIAIVPLAVFYLNLVGVRINLLNSFLTILGILAISCGILWFRAKKSK